ncbi:MAG: endolytic transglycosylase MltG [Thermodesulfovibrionales bacterium]|nr:endolytic transglycosylase MltG [Thermodesulfovibrionales bacterium]
MGKNIIAILLSLIFLYLIYISIEFLVPLPNGTKTKEIQIPQGATFRQAVEILGKENLIRDKSIFLFIGRLTGLHRKIRAGYYSITGSMNPLDVLILLKNGQIIEYDITVVEGDSLLEIREKLVEKNIGDRQTFRKIARDSDFLKSFNIDAPSIEGYLFPDTYKMPKGIEAENALAMMINSMRAKYSAKLRERATELGLTENEVLTLASIIEKEAIINSERPLISAVYHNRLKKRMLLQADPTAVYGIKSSKERITMSDLKRKTPYNTYVIKGLPPGPIASPGIKSIEAALYPADERYLYFVSNNDGTHQFSVTSEEHITAVKAYREMRKIDKEIEKLKEKEKQKEIEKEKNNNRVKVNGRA